MPDVEVWDTASGNLLFEAPDLEAALTWSLRYGMRNGAEALAALAWDYGA